MAKRSAVVTGSSRGIGLAFAERFAQQGYDVCLNCSRESSLPALKEVAERLQVDYGVSAMAYAANVAHSDEAAALIDAAYRAFGRVDVLVNNAGITRDSLALRMGDQDFDEVLGVNLKGAFNCCRAALRPMMKQRFGRIVNVSSVVGLQGNAGQVNYAASKAGLIGLTKSLAKEVASRGITVNAVAPGFITTDMTASLSDAQSDQIVARIAVGRLGVPEDVAVLVFFLASDEAAYITGQTVCVDGGLAL